MLFSKLQEDTKMAEHKYQTIDPDSSKYKLTADDIKGEKKYRKMKRKAEGKRRGVSKALIALLLILALIAGGGFFAANYYLSKINYGDMEAEIDPNLDAEETFTFEGQAQADEDIRKNLSDNVMWYDDRVLNVLLIGYDLGDIAEQYFPRSDSMIIVSINTVTKDINMVSLSRATYAAIPGHGNKRLNTAHAYGGATLLASTVEQNYKVRIDKYAAVDFSRFQQIINILGGVDIKLSAKEAQSIIGKEAAGTYHLNGEKALAYSRLRWIDNDRTRTGRQRNVINAIIDKFKSTAVTDLIKMADDILPLVTTNFTKTEVVAQITKVPTYITMPIHEAIVPHKAPPFEIRDNLEVLILDWPAETAYLHDLLYPDMIPQSAQEQGQQPTP